MELPGLSKGCPAYDPCRQHRSRFVAYGLSTWLLPSPSKSITPSFCCAFYYPNFSTDLLKVLSLMVTTKSTANVLTATRTVARLV